MVDKPTNDTVSDAAAPAVQADDVQEAGADKYGRQMYKTVCAKCKGEAMVPFKPSNDRPVYCQNCYQPRPRRDFGDRSGHGGRGFGDRGR